MLFLLNGLGVRGVDPSEMAVMFFRSVEDFVSTNKPRHLKTVCVVIFQDQMVDQFTKAIAREAKADVPSSAGLVSSEFHYNYSY